MATNVPGPGNGPGGEPIAWSNAIPLLATAVIGVAVQFGVNLTQGQTTSLMALIGALIVVGTLIGRSKVTPTKHAQDAIDKAAAAPQGSTPPKL